ncbi:unnamed protein product [Camellia sinensis]
MDFQQRVWFVLPAINPSDQIRGRERERERERETGDGSGEQSRELGIQGLHGGPRRRHHLSRRHLLRQCLPRPLVA